MEGAEVVETIYETHTQAREENVSKVKKLTKNKYLQVGSFRKEIEANRMQEKLSTLKVKSIIEKNKIGMVTWNRVIIGPFGSSSEINKLINKLKNYEIDSMIFKKLTL